MRHTPLVLASLFFFSGYGTTVLATSDTNPPYQNETAKPAPVDMATINGLFFMGGLGYAWTQWRSEFGPLPDPSTYKYGNGGFSFGLAMGYQFLPNLAAELGYNYFPTAQITTSVPTKLCLPGTLKIASYTIYGDLRIIAPLYNNFDIFGKVGAAYYYTKFSNVINFLSNSSRIAATFGTGFDYYFNNGFFINGTWQVYLGGRRISIATPTLTTYQTNPSEFLANVGYKFAL